MLFLHELFPEVILRERDDLAGFIIGRHNLDNKRCADGIVDAKSERKL